MDEDGDDSIIELDADSWISVEIDRQWPKYIATWSIRRRSGDSDFPIRSGTVEAMPPSNPADLDGTLARLRQEAMDQANAVTAELGQEEASKKGGFLHRLFNRA